MKVERLSIYSLALAIALTMGGDSLRSQHRDEEGAHISADEKNEPVEQAVQSAEEETSQENLTGAETLTLSEDRIGFQGNWVRKRKWLEQALPINNEIQESVLLLEQSRKSLNEKYSSIQQTLGLFYRAMGFEQGKIEYVLEDVEKYLEKRKQLEIEDIKQTAQEEKEVPVGFYDYKAEEVNEKIHEHKRDLEQLRLDIKSLEELDASLAERLKKVDEYIKVVLQDSSNSRILSDEIWYIIDDQKARDNFYKIKNIGEKVKNIVSYIQVDLTKNYDEVTERIKNQMESIKKEIKELEAKGYVIENRAQRIEQLRKEKAKTTSQPEEVNKAPRHTHVKKRKEEVPWYLWPFSAIKNRMVAGVNYCVDFVYLFFDSSSGMRAHKKKA